MNKNIIINLKNKIKKSISYLISIPLIFRRLLLILLDFASIFLSFFIVLSIDFNSSDHIIYSLDVILKAIIFILISLPIYILTNQYKGITRYIGSISFYALSLRNLLSIFIFNFILFSLGKSYQLSLDQYLFLLIFISLFSSVARLIVRDVILRYRIRKSSLASPKVFIYGAGNAGAQLASSLRLSGNYKILGFIDDNSDLWNRSLNGTLIYPPKILPSFRLDIDFVLLAIPSITKSRRSEIINSLTEKKFKVLLIPSIEQLTSGEANIDNLKPIKIEDLLSREPVNPLPELLGPCISSQVVCVTGAGGSIGSELCRTILKLKPKALILIDNSEPSLYTIHQELFDLITENIKVYPLLGDVKDKGFVDNVISSFSVEVVFHAAAYKHVPIVEDNPISGLYNNVFSTLVLCKACYKFNVKRFILISTDKAVRPTNIMGASKRLAELVTQSYAEIISFNINNLNKKTIYSMVRFGNVIGSSGSVIPLFKKQIKNGGPITLTNSDMTRYFMTISEAAQLVIQSVSLAKGGDVFLLDMGTPVKIRNLAENLIRLSDLTIRNNDNPNGDIEIICTGLRPGEKLFEELLISAESMPTKHPLIYRANEESISFDHLMNKLDCLKSYLLSNDLESSLRLLSELVPEWKKSH